MKTAHLTLESKLFSEAWKITGPENLHIPFRQPLLWWNKPKQLSALSAPERFQALLDNNRPFTEYWARATGGYGSDVIRLMFHAAKNSWWLPWELLLDRLNQKGFEHVVITRGNGGKKDIQPTEFVEPLRVQVVLGDNSGRRGRLLDLDAEVVGIKEIYGGRDSNVRHSVRLLPPAQPTLDELPQLLRTERPDVLWFSGHGQLKPPAFCLKQASGKFRDLTPAHLSRIIQETGIRPVYVVFLACHLGLGSGGEQFDTSPEFFKELVPCGIQGMLVMQGAIKDTAAIRLATALFDNLGTGRPLDWAVANARSLVRDAMPPDSVEWARPAVWSCGVPPELKLSFEGSIGARRQVAARQVLRARLPSPTEVDVPAPADACDRAKRWLELGVPRVQLLGSPPLAAAQSLWIRLLLALQMVSSQSVMVIELETEDTVRAVRSWAEAVHAEAARWYEPFLRSTDILPQMMDDPRNAWPELCATDGIIIAVQVDHRAELEPWFLAPLEQRQKSLTLLLRDAPLAEPWPVENLDTQSLDEQQLGALAEHAQPLVNSLAVVGMPVRESWLQDANLLTENLRNQIRPVLVKTEAGDVLNASASAYFSSRMDADERRGAHLNCMRILDHPDVRLRASGNPPVRVLRLRHCLAAQMEEEALQECQAALTQMRKLDRPWRALEIGSLVEHLYQQFPPTVSLCLAWASIMTGDVPTGEILLKGARNVEDPLERAWYHGLMAEVYQEQGIEGTGSRRDRARHRDLAVTTTAR